MIATAASDGFAPLLVEASETGGIMREALLAINPLTMQGLSPVAFLVGEDEAMVFLSSILTADFTLVVRLGQTRQEYAPRAFEFIPYAATYQAAMAGSAVTSGAPRTKERAHGDDARGKSAGEKIAVRQKTGSRQTWCHGHRGAGSGNRSGLFSGEEATAFPARTCDHSMNWVSRFDSVKRALTAEEETSLPSASRTLGLAPSSSLGQPSLASEHQ